MTSKIKRIVHYYSLDFTFTNETLDSDYEPVEVLIKTIESIVKSKAKIRYQHFGDKYIYVHDLVFRPTHDLFTGKIRCVRRDLLPELMNTRTDVVRGIQAAEEEGVVETTHFILKPKKVKESYEVMLALEFNQYGARIQDMEYYFRNIGIEKSILKNLSIGILPSGLSLKDLNEKIGAVSNIELKLSRDRINDLIELDEDYFEFASVLSESFEQDYVHMNLKYDPVLANQKARKFVTEVVQLLSSDIQKSENFQVLKITAKNETSKRKTLEVFDLLVDKMRSEITVEKKKEYRTLVSESMFGKMLDEFEKFGL